jgi:hypothetical protein
MEWIVDMSAPFRFLAGGFCSPLLVRMEDEVLALYCQMARMPAIGRSRVRYHLAGLGFMVEQRVAPATSLRKSLAVLLD